MPFKKLKGEGCVEWVGRLKQPESKTVGTDVLVFPCEKNSFCIMLLSYAIPGKLWMKNPVGETQVFLDWKITLFRDRGIVKNRQLYVVKNISTPLWRRNVRLLEE